MSNINADQHQSGGAPSPSPRPTPTPRPKPTPVPRPQVTLEQFEHTVEAIEASNLPPEAKKEVIQLVGMLYGFKV